MILCLSFALVAHVAGAAANVSKSLASSLAADDLCREKDCATELVQIRAGRHQPPSHFEASDVHFDHSPALVDTVKGQYLPILGNDTIVVQSAIPVFTSNSAYIALLFANSRCAGQEGFWNKTKDVKHFCRTKDGKHEAVMEKFGGEYGRPYDWEVVWKCAWPMERNSSYCHDVVVLEATSPQDKRVIGEVQACDRRMAHLGGDFPYKLAACVRPIFESYALQNSGIVKLPQWLEYNVIHGVDHFLIYTLKSKPREGNITMKIAEPYFKAGLASHIELDMPWGGDASKPNANKVLQLVMENDCLYRYKGRSQWVMPSVDVDEYLHIRGQTEETSFTEILPLPNSSYEVDVWRYLNEAVSDPMTMLDIQSTRREVNPPYRSTPKYIASTTATNVCFVHWATSWVNGTTKLRVPLAHAHVRHYRELSFLEAVHESDEIGLEFTSDADLAKEVSTLQKRLQVRYGMPWQDLQAQLHRGVFHVPTGSSQTFLLESDAKVDASAVELNTQQD